MITLVIGMIVIETAYEFGLQSTRFGRYHGQDHPTGVLRLIHHRGPPSSFHISVTNALWSLFLKLSPLYMVVSLEGACPCNICQGHVPATFLCVCASLNPFPGLEKYLDFTLPVGQVALNFCLSGTPPHLQKFSNSLIIHEPKDGSHA